MVSTSMDKECLSCKFYRVDDIYSGFCRRDKGGARPMMRHGDVCEFWKDAGQQYYIRCGWIRARRKSESEPAA